MSTPVAHLNRAIAHLTAAQPELVPGAANEIHQAIAHILEALVLVAIAGTKEPRT